MPTVSNVELNRWNDRVESILKHRREEQEPRWQEYLDMYRNRFDVSVRGALDQINVNYVIPNVRIKTAFLAQKKPKFFITPKKPKWYSASRLAESGIDAVWKISNAAWTMRMVLLDSAIYPHGAVKVGYQFDEDRFTSNKKDFPFIKRISPRDIFWDTNIADSDPRSGRFMFERIFAPKAQLREQGFKNLDDVHPIGFETDFFKRKELGGRLRSISTYGTDEEREIVQLFRLQDKIDQKNIWFSLEGKEALLVEDWKLPLDSFDYHVLQFNPVPDQIYGMSDIEAYRSQQLELNKIRTFMINHISRSGRKFLVQKGVFTKDEMEQLLSNLDQMVLECSGDPQKINPLPDAPIPTDMYRSESAIKEDIRVSSGVSEYEVSGQIPGGDTTATAAALVTAATRRRSDDAQAVYEKFMIDIATDLLVIMQKLTPTDFWIQVTEPETVAEMQQLTESQGNFFKVKKEQIQGDMMVWIDPGSMTERNDALRTQQFIQVLNLLLGQPGTAQRLKQDKLLRHILEIFEAPKDIVLSEEEFQQQQAAAMQQQMQMQAQQLQMQQMIGGETKGGGEPQGFVNQGTPEAIGRPDLAELLGQINNLGGVGGQL